MATRSASATLSCTLSVSVNSYTATFTGTLSGVMEGISWTLYPGDGSNYGGAGSSVLIVHTYDSAGVFTATLSGTDLGGDQATCQTTVNIHQGMTLDLQDQLSVSDSVRATPPLVISDALNFLDRTLAHLNPSLVVNDSAGLSDQTGINPPAALNEGASIGDQASVLLNSQTTSGSGPFGGLVLPVSLGLVGVAALAAILWRFVLPRRGAG